MKYALIFGACALLGACNTLDDITKNPNCVTRVTLRGSYGGGIPTGTWSAGAVCNGPKAPAKEPPAPPAEDKAPEPAA